MDWARVEFLYDCFSYALAQLWLLWKPPKRPILGRADGKACVLCANPQWQQVYFGHALGCDMPILEALWCALEPKSLQAIWQELADKAQFDDRPWDDLRPLFAVLEKDGWCNPKDGWYWNTTYDGGTGEWFAHRGPERQLLIRVDWNVYGVQLGWRYNIQWQEPGQRCKATSFGVVDRFARSSHNNLWHHLAKY